MSKQPYFVGDPITVYQALAIEIIRHHRDEAFAEVMQWKSDYQIVKEEGADIIDCLRAENERLAATLSTYLDAHSEHGCGTYYYVMNADHNAARACVRGD